MTITVDSTAITFNDGTTQSTAATGGNLTALSTATLTSGSTYTFTGIPTTAKRITVMFQGLSLTATGTRYLRVGNSGGIITTGYSSGVTANAISAIFTTYIMLAYSSSTAYTDPASSISGVIVLCNLGSGLYTWSGYTGIYTGSAWYQFLTTSQGGVTATGGITQIQFGASAGTFDAGYARVMYEN